MLRPGPWTWSSCGIPLTTCSHPLCPLHVSLTSQGVALAAMHRGVSVERSFCWLSWKL